jgi:hypothetical protein
MLLFLFYLENINEQVKVNANFLKKIKHPFYKGNYFQFFIVRKI